MFRSVVVLTLVAQMLQLFACCESCCAESASTAVPAAATGCCHHDHAPCSQDELPEQPAHDEEPHHVCLATHLFYVRDTGDVRLPAPEMARLTCSSAVRLCQNKYRSAAACDVPPSRGAAAARAAIGAYLL